VDRHQRRFLACLTAVAALVAVAQGMSGISQLTLYLAPLFVIAALLLCGRYLAEDRIVRRWRAAVPRRRPRRAKPRRPVVADTPLASRLANTARLERGPPAVAGA
jgi:hypothetical protein